MAGRRPRAGAIIVAAGSGSRFGGKTPKQFVRLSGKPLLLHSLHAVRSSPEIGPVVVVAARQHLVRVERMIRNSGVWDDCKVVPGGRRRQDSVFNGLQGFDEPPEIVLVHDSARPLVTRQMIAAILRLAIRYHAAITALPVTDTLKKERRHGFVGSTVPRSGLWSAQTPQAFGFELLIKAHKRGRRRRLPATDDAALVEHLGVPVRILMGNSRNIKITTRSDLRLAEALLKTSRWKSGSR